MGKSDGWSAFLFLICVAVTLGAVIPIGYSFGVVNAPGKYIRKWCNESIEERYDSDISENGLTVVSSTFVSIFLIGGIIGSFFSSMSADKLGRKFTLLIVAIIYVIGGLMLLLSRFANSIELLLAGRLVCGFGAALVYTSQPMYLVELAPPAISGSVGVFTCIGVTGGIVVGQLFSFEFMLGSADLWNWAISGFLIFVILGYLPFIIFPESPRFYMSKGNNEKAKAALERMRGNADLAVAEVVAIQASSQTGEKMSFVSVLCKEKYLMPLIIICSYHVVQQLSGINAIFYYSISMFTNAGFTMKVATWLNFGAGTLNFVVSAISSFLMSKYNRRILMMVSCLVCMISLLFLAIGLHMMDLHSSIAFMCIAFLALYIIFFNIGLGPIPFFIGSEILDIGPRAAAMSIGSLCNWISNFLIGMFFPILQSSIGPFTFIPCALVCLYGLILTYLYLPETLGHDAKEIGSQMENGFRSRYKKNKTN